MYKRIIAFDVGDVWIGVAHTDLLQTIAIPLATWKTNEFDAKFRDYLILYPVDVVLIGLPKTLKNHSSEQTNKVYAWYEGIRGKYPDTHFVLIDERLSSQFAKNILVSSKSKKNSDHSLAAAIILENYLLSKNILE
jgi:putative Holliday junction resolvase